jgi:ubiquinol-cytochrome c reductase cytochrome b subunit
VGSNNPDGVEIKKHKDENGIPLDGIKFHPYYSVHDIQGIAVFLFFFCGIIFFAPEMGGYFLELANFEEANALKTPAHIAPVWYYTPYYSVLRAVPDKFWGFVAFAASVAIPFALPWIDRNPVRSWRYRGMLNRVMLLGFVISFIILGVLGVKAPTESRTLLAQICTIYYFVFFLGMYWWSTWDKTKEVPDRITMDGGMGFGKNVATLAVVAVLTWLPLKAVGAESAYDCGSIPCDEFVADASDQASLQHGAALYANYCAGCHSLQYSRHNRVAKDLGIPEDLYREHLLLDPDQKIGALMDISMDKDVAKGWFGAAPPDLTLISRAKKPEYLYTYLRTFYQDDSRPYGVNNLVYPNVGMPHVLLELQGLPQCVNADESHADEGHCDSLEVASAGIMTTDQFDDAMYDLVNFLAYTAEPFKQTRIEMGKKVMLFLAIFFIIAWALNREYWKDVH